MHFDECECYRCFYGWCCGVMAWLCGYFRDETRNYWWSTREGFNE